MGRQEVICCDLPWYLWLLATCHQQLGDGDIGDGWGLTVVLGPMNGQFQLHDGWVASSAHRLSVPLPMSWCNTGSAAGKNHSGNTTLHEDFSSYRDISIPSLHCSALMKSISDPAAGTTGASICAPARGFGDGTQHGRPGELGCHRGSLHGGAQSVASNTCNQQELVGDLDILMLVEVICWIVG